MFALKAVLLAVLVALVSCKPKPKHYLIETVSFLVDLFNLSSEGVFLPLSLRGGGGVKSVHLA